MFAATSNLRLLENIDITNDYINTFSFVSEGSQSSFFISKTKAGRVYNDFVFIRKDNSIKVPVNIESLWNVSYLMFQNNNFGLKWFYGFITDMRYLNDETTEIFFEIDVLQTWYFEMDIKDSFIEREHVDDDTLFLHKIQENLNIGETIVRTEENVSELEERSIVVASTFNNDPPTYSDYFGHVVGGIYSGLAYLPWREQFFLSLGLFLDNLNSAGKIDGINSIFYMPSYFLGDFPQGVALELEEPITLEKSVPKNTVDLDGYIPKNNKVFTFPYNYLQVSNYNGTTKIYKYEYSDLSTMDFNINCNINPNPTLLLTPQSYKGDNINYTESISTQGYPLCTWINDVYANWLAQNVVSAPLSVVSSGLALGVGIATMNPIAIAGGAIGVANSIGGFIEKSVVPDQARGNNNGNVNTAINNVNFSFQRTTITNEYAKIIDNYFDKFGYKVNVLKTPNLTNRTNWNYIKMREANIFGNIPNKDLKKIHEIFNDGLTYWHNDNVGNYDRFNPII